MGRLQDWNRSDVAIIDALKDEYQLIAIDPRGFGESDKPQGPYPISAYADDLAYVIEQLGLGGASMMGSETDAPPEDIQVTGEAEPADESGEPMALVGIRRAIERFVQHLASGAQDPRVPPEVFQVTAAPTLSPALVRPCARK
jgi:hypothetical protein